MRSEHARKHGWRSAQPSLHEPGVGDQVHWLVDNRAAYDALLAAIRRARKSIWITQLAFDVDCLAYQEESATGDNLFEAIVRAVDEQRVHVRVLLNSSILLNTKRALARAVAERVKDSDLVEVRGLSRFPQLLHAKMVIIDGSRAFLMGSPFVNGYWDSEKHPAEDVRRPRRELGGRGVHDVSVEVRGRAARDIEKCFDRLWRFANRTDADKAERIPDITPRPAAGFVRVLTTEPKGFTSPESPGSRETLNAILAGIQRARNLIYIEHQYLSSRPVANALRTALDREPALEIVMVLNQNPDVTAYRVWQNARLGENGLLGHPRVGLFAIWTIGESVSGTRQLNQVFVHSKVVSVDDRWAVVGSSNLDGASLDSYGDDFSGRLGRRVFRDVRNFDVSLEVNAERRMPGTPNPVRALREHLWREHLCGPGDAGDAGSGLGTWRKIAAQNAQALMSVDATESGLLRNSFVLPYSTKASPRAQLSEAGVTLSESVDLLFEPGWVERNLSPNWFRNMFG